MDQPRPPDAHARRPGQPAIREGGFAAGRAPAARFPVDSGDGVAGGGFRAASAPDDGADPPQAARAGGQPCPRPRPGRTLRRPGESSPVSGEDRDWQRLDKWLWCARFMRARSDCAALAAAGALRINRLPTDKAHARLRVGDVITLALRGDVRVIEVLALAP